MNREQLVEQLNNSGLSSQLSTFRQALMHIAAAKLIGETPADTVKDSKQAEDRSILANCGPAAATAAIEFATAWCAKRGKLSEKVRGRLTTNSAHNFKIIQNDDVVGGYDGFSNVLRQFLLPRSAYLDFDTVVDPRHQIDLECGYPKFITPIMYRYMYDRDDVARRVVDFYPNECWSTDPQVFTTVDEDTWEEFELDWLKLQDDHNILGLLYRIDKLSGIGHYGALLMGVDDGLDLDQPIQEPALLAGVRRSVSSKRRELLYLRPFDEYLSFIHQYETDVLSPRYGLPKYYNLVFLDMTIDAAGASIGTRLNRRVHWSRVIHVADNLTSSLVFGTPRQQPVFNRELDLRKMKGASAEMLWKGGFPGLSFEIDPQFVADDPDFDKEEFRKEIQRYADGLQRNLMLVGIKATSLASQIPTDPQKYIDIQLQAIAMEMDVPEKIWRGSEEGRVAGTQDSLSWNKRLGRRVKKQVDPNVLRNAVDRFIAVGVMAPPKGGKYFTDWADLNTPTDEDKANLALKWTQALSQYVASGVIHLIPPMEYMTTIMGIKPSDAKRILDDAEKAGGFAKLLKVDPSQGAGQNGVRESNVSNADKEGTSGSRPTKRDSADKKAEGTAS